jgi:competence protein ComEA
MKNKFIIAGITCCFFLISGICYSCAYNNKDTSATLVTSLTENGVKPGAQNNTKDESTEQELQESVSEEQKTNPQSLEELNSKELTPEERKSQELSKDEVLIYVHICGAVVNPGVYEAVSGTRLFDFIELSGGLTKDAAGDYINQAQPVCDGQRIYIPTEDEVKELPMTEYAAGQDLSENQSTFTVTDAANQTGDTDTPSKKVNVNTANAEELMSLPGIGQAKAKSIIDYRVTNGNFKTIEELMSIPGIKEGLFNQISSYIIAK